MNTNYIPVKVEDWVKMVEATKVAADLLAENERLKKAGDDLMGNYYATCLNVDGFNEWPSVKAWLAAKEGSDAIGCLVNPAKVAQYLPKPNASKKGSDAK